MNWPDVDKEFHYEVRLRGVVRAPNRTLAEAFVKNHLTLTLVLHDSVDDLSITVHQDPFDKLRELPK